MYLGEGLRIPARFRVGENGTSAAKVGSSKLVHGGLCRTFNTLPVHWRPVASMPLPISTKIRHVIAPRNLHDTHRWREASATDRHAGRAGRFQVLFKKTLWRDHRVTATGRTSLTVEVELWAEDLLTGKRELCTKGSFVLVAVDEHGRPEPIASTESQ